MLPNRLAFPERRVKYSQLYVLFLLILLPLLIQPIDCKEVKYSQYSTRKRTNKDDKDDKGDKDVEEEKEDPDKYCKGEYLTNCASFHFIPRKNASSCTNTSFLSGSQYLDISHFAPQNVTLPVRNTMETLTNAFENGKEGFNYTAIEYLGDGRGWTAGRVGFTSGTGDLLTVLERYRDQWVGKENSTLFLNLSPEVRQAYRGLISTIPTLQRISALPVCDRRGRDDISQLGNLPHDWVLAAEGDLAFRRVQDLVTYEMYLWPSSRFASSVSVHSPLGQAIFYDTIVQHGWQKTESDINIARIIQLTNTTSPAQGEAEYLSQFLRVRRSMLCCYREDMTWPSSAGRVADLQRALEQGNLALNQDIYLESIGVVVGKAGTYSSEGKRI